MVNQDLIIATWTSLRHKYQVINNKKSQKFLTQQQPCDMEIVIM